MPTLLNKVHLPFISTWSWELPDSVEMNGGCRLARLGTRTALREREKSIGYINLIIKIKLFCFGITSPRRTGSPRGTPLVLGSLAGTESG